MNNILHLALLGLLTLAPSGSATSFKHCVQLDVPVPVVATNRHYLMPSVDSNIDAVDWTVNVTTWSTIPRAAGNVSIDATFSINAQLCVPSQNGTKAGILQIATPGLGYDKRYWDVEIRPEEYSYVDAAIKKGYSVLTYDRLGTGQSEKPNAYDVVQIPTEIEILAGLTQLARDGKLLSASRVLSSTTPFPNYQPTKIVQLGHSFGSFLIVNMLAKYPHLGDGALLTALLLNSHFNMIDVAHFNHDFAAEHDPVRFGGYGSGYFVLSTQNDLQKLFFRKGAFEPELLAYNDRIKQPEALGEYASEVVGLSPAMGFTGPVQFLTGEFDYFICEGDCRGTYNETQTHDLFPNASDRSPYLQPNTGHTLTLATNATAGYEVMFQYLETNGL